MNRLLSRETTPTRRHRPLNLAELPNLLGFTRFASTACSHKVHSWGAACVAVSFHPNSQIGAVYACAEAIQVGKGLCPFEPCREGGTPPRAPPRVYILAQGERRKSVDFFTQSLLYVFSDFHTFGPFPERIVLFQVSGTIYDA